MIGKMIEIAGTTIDIVLLVYFLPPFLKVSPFGNKKTLFVPLGLLITQLLMDHFISMEQIVYMCVVTLITFGYAISLRRSRWVQSVLGTFIYVGTLMLTGSTMFAFVSFATQNDDFLMPNTNLVPRIIFIASTKLLQFIIFRIVLFLLRSDQALDLKRGLPAIFYSVTTEVALALIMNISLDDTSNQHQAPLLIVTLILLLLNFIYYIALGSIQHLLKEKYEYQLIAERLESEKQRLNEAQSVWEEVRKLRHDMKNHLLTLAGQLKKDETERSLDYIYKLTERIDEQSTLVYFGHPIIDYLLHTKLSLLRDVDLHLVGSASNLPQMEDLDLVCIVGNLLDNAMEALKKVSADRKLTVSILRVEQNCLITVKNTITSSVLGSNPDLKTTKSSPLFHGLGHRIVKETVGKYGGHIAYSEADGMFCVQILLPLPLHE